MAIIFNGLNLKTVEGAKVNAKASLGSLLSSLFLLDQLQLAQVGSLCTMKIVLSLEILHWY